MTAAYLHALELLAQSHGQTFSEYVRWILEEHVRELSHNSNESCVRLERLHDLVKQYILTWRSITVAGLPSTEKRDKLETITWQAIHEALEWSRSEEAAAKARARARIMHLVNALIRTELAILDSRDEAHVEELVQELEAELSASQTEAAASPRKKAAAGR